jgi:hypothetical protein
MFLLLFAFVSTLFAHSESLSSFYGEEPWVKWWGTPLAPLTSTVISSRGTARFTVLTPRLIRLERSPLPQAFEDARSWVVWNREMEAVDFTTSTTGDRTIIDTGVGGVLLEYDDDGMPFSDTNLRVTRRSAAFWPNSSTVWTPSATPFNDGGQLFGTFHTLDNGHEGYAGGGMNCSLLDPNAYNNNCADYVPCDFGLLSKSGFALVDDSRTPVWDDNAGWPRARTGGSTCAAPGAPTTPCFPPAFDTSDADMCVAVGCCVDAAPSTLTLWYSAQRDDHFTDSANCSACAGLDYVFLHAQGGAWPTNSPGLVALNLYWNAGQRDGASGDNVASTFPPQQPGYTFSRIEGYVYDPALPQPADTIALKLFYSSVHLDHWTTSSAADEAAAAAAGYTLVGLVGYTVLTASPPPQWKCSAPDVATSRTDWYLFSHGSNYSAALGDYVAIAGAVPIPRRHWLGISWSTWDEKNNQSATEAQVASLLDGGWPLDTYIFDMQWHLTPSWGGYEWDSVRYPNVTDLLASLQARGLATGMNLHDADGITAVANPTLWAAVREALGLASDATAANFDIGNRTYADVLAGLVLGPLQAQGLDLLWTDFQQGFPGVSAIPGLNPTAMLNHYRFYNASINGARGSQHSRYAGRGDHRHASAFGGDVNESWASLIFMIDFTKTAANTPLCYWGHEMMRQGGSINDNSELFTRTNQFGAWSPIFTSWGNGGENNLWWKMPEPFASATRESLRDREQLLPYRYSAAALTFKTGVCSHHGMHFDFPEEVDAYDTTGQFMLGTDLIVAPAFAPVSPPIPPVGGGDISGVIGVRVWVPPGTWVSFTEPSRTFSTGWTIINATIFDVPVLARAGAIVPLLPRNMTAIPGVAASAYSSLVFRHLPGGSENSAAVDVYEDDGLSTAYLMGTTAMTSVRVNKGTCETWTVVTVGMLYDGFIRSRSYEIETGFGAPTPSNVTEDGIILPRADADGVSGTYFVSLDHVSVYLRAGRDALSVATVEMC